MWLPAWLPGRHVHGSGGRRSYLSNCGADLGGSPSPAIWAAWRFRVYSGSCLLGGCYRCLPGAVLPDADRVAWWSCWLARESGLTAAVAGDRERRPAWSSASRVWVGRLIEVPVVDDRHRVEADFRGDPGQQLVLRSEMALHVRHLVGQCAGIRIGRSASRQMSGTDAVVRSGESVRDAISYGAAGPRVIFAARLSAKARLHGAGRSSTHRSPGGMPAYSEV